LNEHPLRRRVVGEMHLRRWPRIAVPCRIMQVLRISARKQRAAERAMLGALPPGASCAPPTIRACRRHDQAGAAIRVGTAQRACGITLFIGEEAADPAAAMAWVGVFPARRSAPRVFIWWPAMPRPRRCCRRWALWGPIWCRARSGWRGAAVVGFPHRAGGLWRLGGGGQRRGRGDLARLLQRFQELGNYRNLALMGLPVAQGNWARLDAAEAALRRFSTDVARPDLTDDALLERVSALSLDLMSLSTETSYRMSATAAYAQLVEERLAGLLVRPIDGFPSLEDFTQRRLPAIRTAQAYTNRLNELTAQAAHFTSLLRTRIETRIENQNARLLRSMERSFQPAIAFAATGGRLSVVALSYYGISLLGYMLKAAEHR
jgi:uncharacterized membrane-anchored protein